MQRDELINLTAPYTGLSPTALGVLYDFVSKYSLPAGAVVQCGVVNGGSAVLLWHACDAGPRDLWMFDSWEGLPPPTEQDGGKASSKYIYHMTAHGSWCKGDIEKAREIAVLGGVPRKRTHLVKGWFKDTLPVWAAKVGPIAMLHLDADWYDSTLDCLKWLYPLLVPGGLLILDDYGHWIGTDAACREYGIDPMLTATPPCGAWMIAGQDPKEV